MHRYAKNVERKKEKVKEAKTNLFIFRTLNHKSFRYKLLNKSKHNQSAFSPVIFVLINIKLIDN